MDKTINKINEIIKKEKLTRKAIYENLLAQGIVKPNSEKWFNETLEYALENGLINPNRIKRFSKKRGKLPEVYTTEQLIKIFDELERPKLAVCVWLGFFCGLRIREVCNLQITDIDLQNKIIKIKNSKNTNRKKECYGKDRIVVIPDLAISPLKKWIDIIQGGNWFIPSMQDSNKPIRTKTIHEQYRFLLRKCGLSQQDHMTEYKQKNHGRKKSMKKSTYKYKFHTLRHTYATYLLDKGVPLENIQRSLGHNQIDTTLIYARVRDTKTNEFVNNAFSMPMRLLKKNNVMIPEIKEPSKIDSVLSAEEILRQRLAKGEIDLILYKRLLAELNPDNKVNVILRNEEK